MSNFPERDSDDATKLDRLRGYAVAVEGYSFGVLQEASRRILRGGIDKIDPRFMPTPPQLARLCDTIRAEQLRQAPQPLRLERFETPPDPKLTRKFDAVMRNFAVEADRVHHETRDEWIARMGDRVRKSA